jgi:hypothetical protein
MQQNVKMPWKVVVSFLQVQSAEAKKDIGGGRDILLQRFHWKSHQGSINRATSARKSWNRIIEDNVAALKPRLSKAISLLCGYDIDVCTPTDPLKVANSLAGYELFGNKYPRPRIE